MSNKICQKTVSLQEAVGVDEELRPDGVGGVQDGTTVGFVLLVGEEFARRYSEGKGECREFDDIALRRKNVFVVVNRVAQRVFCALGDIFLGQLCANCGDRCRISQSPALIFAVPVRHDDRQGRDALVEHRRLGGIGVKARLGVDCTVYNAPVIDDVKVEFLEAESPSCQFALGVHHAEQPLKRMMVRVDREAEAVEICPEKRDSPHHGKTIAVRYIVVELRIRQATSEVEDWAHRTVGWLVLHQHGANLKAVRIRVKGIVVT